MWVVVRESESKRAELKIIELGFLFLLGVIWVGKFFLILINYRFRFEEEGELVFFIKKNLKFCLSGCRFILYADSLSVVSYIRRSLIVSDFIAVVKIIQNDDIDIDYVIVQSFNRRR